MTGVRRNDRVGDLLVWDKASIPRTNHIMITLANPLSSEFSNCVHNRRGGDGIPALRGTTYYPSLLPYLAHKLFVRASMNQNKTGVRHPPRGTRGRNGKGA